MTEPEQVEQITKVPSTPPPRVKDPKKVAAGKALQVKNREAKEELLRYRAQEAERNKQMKHENEEYKAAEEERLQVEDPSPGFFSRISFSDILSLAGVGLTIYALFFKKEAKKKKDYEVPVEIEERGHTFEPQPKAKDRPKFGM